MSVTRREYLGFSGRVFAGGVDELGPVVWKTRRPGLSMYYSLDSRGWAGLSLPLLAAIDDMG